MFIGSKHCQRCGAAAAIPALHDSEKRKCPRCKSEMVSVTVGSAAVRECERCMGLWLDVLSFEKICADREQQSAVLGVASPASGSAVRESGKLQYVPCPDCSQLMNRINFARCSGVIVDVCKGHGIWFDRDELNRIIEFIRDGGLQASRAKEKLQIEEDRQRLREERLALDRQRSSKLGLEMDDHRATGIASANGLLEYLLD